MRPESSVPHLRAIAARIGTAFEESAGAMDADRLGVTQVAQPLMIITTSTTLNLVYRRARVH